MLGKLPVPVRPTNMANTVGAGGVGLDIFSLNHFSISVCLSLAELSLADCSI